MAPPVSDGPEGRWEGTPAGTLLAREETMRSDSPEEPTVKLPWLELLATRVDPPDTPETSTRLSLPRGARLWCPAGDDAGLVVELQEGRCYLFGRARDCDVRLRADSVSRRHALLFDEAGIWWLRD